MLLKIVILVIVLAAVWLWWSSRSRESWDARFDKRWLVPHHRVQEEWYDNALQPVVRGNYTSGSWMPPTSWASKYESNYKVSKPNWLPDGVVNRQGGKRAIPPREGYSSYAASKWQGHIL